MTGIDGDLLDELADILRWRGRDDAITSSELSDRLNLNDGEASPQTREAIGILRVERGIPVRAGNVGYWCCQTEEEAKEYLDKLRSRIAGIEETMGEFETAWIEWSRTTAATDGGNNRDANGGNDKDVPAEVRGKIEQDPLLTVEDWLEHQEGDT
jgi:hypothetical protein